ncbi:hypothetical protein GOP47_0022716 [Adiantum capillus-veneris]|uniref:Uncharacterized protein n=1 Tax=Adiantum capillus-veneris TaxID=13818 RepID=A0A9D4U6B5_ADICA|nr:hypothetical protein GOP47_0022716 [Adiantum capillus-veneris]
MQTLIHELADSRVVHGSPLCWWKALYHEISWLVIQEKLLLEGSLSSNCIELTKDEFLHAPRKQFTNFATTRVKGTRKRIGCNLGRAETQFSQLVAEHVAWCFETLSK